MTIRDENNNREILDHRLMEIMVDDSVLGIFDMNNSEEQRANYREFIRDVTWMQENGTIRPEMNIAGLDEYDLEEAKHEALLIQRYKPLDYSRCIRKAFYPPIGNDMINRLGLIEFCGQQGAVPTLDQVLQLVMYAMSGRHVRDLVNIISCCQGLGFDVHSSNDILMCFAQLGRYFVQLGQLGRDPIDHSDVYEYLLQQGCITSENYEQRANEYMIESLKN